MRDAVIRGFAFDDEDLARVASSETLDDIIQNSLALRLGDKTFAEEVYQDIRDQAIRASERWLNAKVESSCRHLVYQVVGLKVLPRRLFRVHRCSW